MSAHQSSIPPDIPEQPAGNEPVRVGIRELRHDFRAYLDRAQAGETIIVTDRGREIAELVPRRTKVLTHIEQMIADGRIIPAASNAHNEPGFKWPAELSNDPPSTWASEALQEMREDRL